jgi:hypothetical protein
MPIDDRERPFEQALARHLRDAAHAACPDAEILAAYHERTLSLDEMAKWKEHIATCERCQEALALVEQTESVDSEEWQEQDAVLMAQHPRATQMATRATSLSMAADEALPTAEVAVVESSPAMPRPRANWRWIAPMGAIAAAVIVWLGAIEVRKQHRDAESVQIAQSRRAEEPAVMTKSATPPAESLEQKQADAEKALRKESEEFVAQQKTSPKVSGALSSRQMAAPGEIPEVSGELEKKKDATGYGTGAGNSPAAPAPAARVPSAASVDRRKKEIASPEARDAGIIAGQTAIPMVAAKPSPASPERTRSAVSSVNTSSAEVGGAASTVNTSITNSPIGARDATVLLRLAAADAQYIVAPDKRVGWRAGDGGKIERTEDRGNTWKEQTSGVSTDLRTGSATSAKVCWIVGKAGTILLTTDGGNHWRKIQSPIPNDLGGIHAVDALHASIWDVPNRTSYETSDGGETWNRTANE